MKAQGALHKENSGIGVRWRVLNEIPVRAPYPHVVYIPSKG